MTAKRSLPPAIVIGVDTPTGLTIVRELGARGVPVHGVGRNPDGLGANSRHCHRFHPRPGGPMGAWLGPLVEATGAGALLAWSEGDLVELAALPETIGGARVLTPRAERLARVLDKGRTMAAASKVGIAMPCNWIGTPERWPVVVKWPDPTRVVPKLAAAGVAFEKAVFCTDETEYRVLMARLSAVDERPLVQEYAPGVGIGQMFYMAGGRATLAFQHERLHEWPPEGGVSTLCRSVALSEHGAQRKLSEALLRELDWKGPAMVEYRWDRHEDRYTLMEINGRFWGSQPLAFHAGAEFAWELYRHEVLGDRTPPPPYRAGVKARYMVPETRRLARLIAARDKIADPVFKARPWRDLARYLLGFVDPATRHYIWSARDPGPFFADCRHIARKAIARFARSDRPSEAPRTPGRSDRNNAGNNLRQA